MCDISNLSDDDMLAIAKEDRSVSREEIGIQQPTTKDGMQLLGEGFDFLQFSDQDSNAYKGSDD